MEFVLSALVTWRLAYMLVDEVGPGHIFERFRGIFVVQGKRPVTGEGGKLILVSDRVPKNIIGEILTCIYCCSIWVSFGTSIYLAWLTKEWTLYPLYVFALSAAAIFLEHLRRVLDR